MNEKKILIVLAVFLSVVANVGHLYADPPPWAPAHGYRHKHHDHEGHRKYKKKHKYKKVYKYVYYPEQEVYYYPATKRYYWHQPSGWSFGVKLPGGISLGASSYPVELDTATPYLRHEEIRVKYR